MPSLNLSSSRNAAPISFSVAIARSTSCAEHDVDLHRRIAEPAIGVVHRRYRTERHGVERTVAAAQAHSADRQIFDGAGHARERDPVADLHRVFHQQENAGDEILHQFLRAETERDAEDARARQQRPDVHAEFAQTGEHDHQRDHAEERAAQHRQQGAQARGAHQIAAGGPAVQPPFDRHVDAFPHEQRDDGRHADRHDRRREPVPDRAGAEQVARRRRPRPATAPARSRCR